MELSPIQQAYQPAASAPRVETPKPPVITNTRKEGLRKLVQQSLRRSKCLRLPTQRYGPRSVFQAAQSVIDNSVSDDDIGRLFSHNIAAHVHCPVTGRKLNICKLRKGPDGHIWDYSLGTEWGRLLPNGLRNNGPSENRVRGTSTVFFVQRSQIPTGRKISYGNFICDDRPQKSEIHRVRLTAGGNKLDAYEETSSPTVGPIDAKLHFNITISDAHNGA